MLSVISIRNKSPSLDIQTSPNADEVYGFQIDVGEVHIKTLRFAENPQGLTYDTNERDSYAAQQS